MTFTIEPKNDGAGTLEKPNGFWTAIFVQTPLSAIVGCESSMDGFSIKYGHDGFAGDWFTGDEALIFHETLSRFIETDDCFNHSYFKFRKNQIEDFMEFLLKCGGFRRLDW